MSIHCKRDERRIDASQIYKKTKPNLQLVSIPKQLEFKWHERWWYDFRLISGSKTICKAVHVCFGISRTFGYSKNLRWPSLTLLTCTSEFYLLKYI